MGNTALIRAFQTDTPKGRLSWQATARGRWPFPQGWGFGVQERIERFHQGHLRLGNGASKLQTMRRPLAIVVVLLAMSWVALPALACLLPGRAMTAAEHACCRQMPQMCGSAHMPQSHPCCQKEIQTGSSLAVATNHQFARTLQVLAAIPALSPSPTCAVFSGAAPGSPPSDSSPGFSVLRI